MELFYFTFCGDSDLGGYCQPIYANNYDEARDKMFELHGDKWAFQYTKKQWEKIKNNPGRLYSLEDELEPIYC